MAPSSLFNRDDDEEEVPRSHPPAADASEGVRILGKEEAAEKAASSRRRGDEPRFGDRPPPPPANVTPALSFPLEEGTDPEAIERPRPAPVLNVAPGTGEHELPHWTEPATGKVPKVVIGDDAADEDEDRAWSAYAAGGPRWRDEHRSGGDYDEQFTAELAADSRVGALDTDERMTQEEYLGLSDVDIPAADAPRARSAGSASDPIRIDSDPRQRPPTRPSGARPPGMSSDPGRTGEVGHGDEPPRDLSTAVPVGFGIAAVAVVCFLVGLPGVTLLATAVAVVAGGELFASIRRIGLRPLTPLGLVAIVALVVGAAVRGEAAIPLVLFLAVVVGVLWYLTGAEREGPVSSLAATFLGIVYVGVLGSFTTLIARIGPVGEGVTTEQGVSILLLAAFGAVASDVGGLLVGQRVGRTALTSVSPGKTAEGLIGGLAAAVVAVVVVGQIFGPFSLGQLLLFGIVCGVAAPLGDVAASLFKRDLGIKDWGDILPGHGGVLDRFDGLLFVLPATYYLTRVLLPLG